MDVVEAALVDLDPWFKPANKRDVARILSNCSALTVRRSETEVDIKLMVAAWFDRLSPYPTDVIVWAFNKWVDDNKFFPSWSEIRGLLERRMRYRRKAKQVLGDQLALSKAYYANEADKEAVS